MVNIGKTKVMCSSHNTPNTKITSVKLLCGICWKGIGANSILYLSCKNWLHKHCSYVQESLKNFIDFTCKICSTVAEEVNDPFPVRVAIDGNEFETVSEFCYLGDIIAQAGGCIDTMH